MIRIPHGNTQISVFTPEIPINFDASKKLYIDFLMEQLINTSC